RPRTYQFVPLLMALRLDPIRMLIADDVGVGKTIEALLIVRELLDRGEIKRLCVLCPPYLCEQWQKELSEKFNLDAVLIRSGTVKFRKHFVLCLVYSVRNLAGTKSTSSARRSASNSPVTLCSALVKTSRKIGRATIVFQPAIPPM